MSALTAELVPEPIELVTIDVSYLSLAGAVRQLEGIASTRERSWADS